MYEVIYMKAEYEPWWMFEGWEENVLSRQSFSNIAEAKLYLNELLSKFRQTFKNENEQKNCFAFWTEEEKQFCEACDEDLQIFHGLFLLCKGKPYS